MPIPLSPRAPDLLNQRMHGPSRRAVRQRMGTQERDADESSQCSSALRNICDLALNQRSRDLLGRTVREVGYHPIRVGASPGSASSIAGLPFRKQVALSRARLFWLFFAAKYQPSR
jgi:hypothetical protein